MRTRRTVKKEEMRTSGLSTLETDVDAELAEEEREEEGAKEKETRKEGGEGLPLSPPWKSSFRPRDRDLLREPQGDLPGTTRTKSKD